MENNAGNPTKSRSETIRSSHITAITNPNSEDFKKHTDSSSITILDIGVGAKHPQLSWDLEKGDLWVGCDPGIRKPEHGGGVQVQTGGKEIDQNSTLIIFTEPVERVPHFSPDHISVVAPNPQDIVNGEIFNDELEKFLSGKKQSLVVALDSRTHESAEHRDKATEIIEEWTKNNGFEKDDVEDSFDPNSHDLGASDDQYMSYSRN